MKEKEKLVNLINFLLFIVFTFSGCSKEETKKSYALQPRELAVLDNLLKDEISVFLDGGESLIFKDNILAVTATEVAKEYEENQVSADQKYFKQSLLVTGIISSINSGLGNEPYVVLRGINEFLSPQIHFNKNNVAKVAELKKGQKLSFVCNGAGAIVGTPMFNSCSFADDYAAIKVAEIRTEIHNFLSGENTQSELVPKITIGAITVARELPESSTCFTNGKECSKEITAAFGGDIIKKKMASVSDELKLLGLHIPEKLSR